MKVEIQETSQIARQMEVSIPWNDIAKDYNSYFQKYSKGLQIPGFRKGHVPRSIVQRQFGKKIQFEFFQHHFNQFFLQAVKQSMLEPVTEPELLEISFEEGEDLNFTLQVEVLPSLEVPEYKDGFEIAVPRFSIDDADVEDALQQVLEQRAALEPVEGPAEVGMHVDYTELKEGEEEGSGFEAELSEKENGRAAEAYLLGMSPGESKDIEINGEKITLTLNHLSQKILPEANDEFAQSLGETVKDLDDLKMQLQQQITSRWDNEENKIRSERIRKYFIDKLTDLELPDKLIEGYIDDMAANLEQRYNTSLRNNESIRNSLKPQAVHELKWQLLKDRIADLEAIDITETELTEHIEEQLKSVESSQLEMYRQYYNQSETKGRVRFYLLEDKVMKHLERYAKISEQEVSREQRLKGEF